MVHISIYLHINFTKFITIQKELYSMMAINTSPSLKICDINPTLYGGD